MSSTYTRLNKGYSADLLIDVCNAILKAQEAGDIRENQENLAKQAAIVVGASAKAGIQGLVYALAGYRPEIEEVISAFRQYVQEEAKKYISEEVQTVEAAIEGVHLIIAQDISENVKEAIMYEHNMSEEELLSWSESHYDNDRAKIVSSIQTFYNVIDLINYINENNINLKEEYRGVMY